MADRVYPSGKPNGTAAPAVTNPPQFPPPKSHQYNPAARHPYRPNPAIDARHNHRRCNGRRCFCRCCFWSILIFLVILLLATIAGAILYVLYRPHRPDFSISSLKISQFNLTTTPSDDTTRLTTKFNFTLDSKNPNKKITFDYNPININLFSNQVLLANGTFENFISVPKNASVLHSTLAMGSQLLDSDSDSAKTLRSDLTKKNGLPLIVVMETKVKVKVEKLKSKKIGIKITCDGIHGVVPKDKNATTVASTDNAKCKALKTGLTARYIAPTLSHHMIGEEASESGSSRKSARSRWASVAAVETDLYSAYVLLFATVSYCLQDQLTILEPRKTQ